MCVYAIFEYKQVIQLLPCHVSDIMQTALLITLTTVWTRDSKHYKSATMAQKTLSILTQDFGYLLSLETRSFRLLFIQLHVVSTDRSQQKQRGQTTNGACFKKLICFWESFLRISCDLWWLIKVASIRDILSRHSLAMVSTPHTMLASRNSNICTYIRLYRLISCHRSRSLGLSWCQPPGACDVRSTSCVMVPRPQIMDRLQPGITSHILRQHWEILERSR